MSRHIQTLWHRSRFQAQWQATLMGLWIAVASGLQEMMVEDFEFYAVYESSYSDLALSFLTFKPVEYLCEVVAVFMISRGQGLLSAGIARAQGGFASLWPA
ncbi:MAG: hypothetical protein ACFB5Z_03695 [Elainellaceae cyanobacterium]